MVLLIIILKDCSMGLVIKYCSALRLALVLIVMVERTLGQFFYRNTLTNQIYQPGGLAVAPLYIDYERPYAASPYYYIADYWGQAFFYRLTGSSGAYATNLISNGNFCTSGTRTFNNGSHGH